MPRPAGNPRKAPARSLALPLLAIAALAPSLLPAQESLPRRIEVHDGAVYRVRFDPTGRLVASASLDGSVRLWRFPEGSTLGAPDGHEGRVLDLAFDPAGETLATAGEDRTVRLWSIPRIAPRSLKGHAGNVLHVARSPDGAWLASACDQGEIHLRSGSEERTALRIGPLGQSVRGLCWMRSNNIAVTLADRTLRVFRGPRKSAGGERAALPWQSPGLETRSWQFRRGTAAPPDDWNQPGSPEEGWESGPGGFGYSSEEAELATVQTRLPGMRESFLSLFCRTAFEVKEPSRIRHVQLVITYDDGFVAYLNGEEVARAQVKGTPPAFDRAAERAGEPIDLVVDLDAHRGLLREKDNLLAIQGHNGGLTSSDFVLSARLEIVDRGDGLALPGEEILVSAALPADPLQLTSSLVTGRLAIGLADDRVAWLEPGQTEASELIPWPAGTTGTLIFADANTLASGTAAGGIHRHDLLESRDDEWKDLHEGAVTALVRDGAGLITGGEDGRVARWNGDGSPSRVLATGSSPVRFLRVSRHSTSAGTLSVGRENGQLTLIDLPSGETLGSFRHEGTLRGIGSGADAREILSLGEGPEILRWRSSPLREIGTYTEHREAVYALAFSPDGAWLASGSADRTVRVVSIGDPTRSRTLEGHAEAVYAVAYSPDGKTLASGGYDRTIRLWNLEEGTEIKTMTGHREGVFALSFAPDGRELVSASSDRTLRRWSLPAGEAVGTLEGHEGWILDLRRLAASPDTVLTVDHGGEVVRWSLSAGRRVAGLRSGEVVYSLDVSPDGTRIITAGAGGAIVVHPTPVEGP